MSGHTPGPWEAIEDGTAAFCIGSTDYGTVARIHDPYATECHRIPEVEANARLIAAAPELLEALHNCVDGLDSQPGYCSTRALAYARLIIAKAKGEQP